MFADGLALGIVGRVEWAMVVVVGSRASGCGGEGWQSTIFECGRRSRVAR